MRTLGCTRPRAPTTRSAPRCSCRETSSNSVIGRKIPAIKVTCPCCRKLTLDPFGDHALICMTTGDVVHRHNDLYRHFVAEGRAAMKSLSIETPILIKSADDSYRPDIILSRGIPGYSDKPLGLDLTVTCPLNKTLIQTASKQELYAACKAAALKDRLQKDDFDNLGCKQCGSRSTATSTERGTSTSVMRVASASDSDSR